MWTLLFEHHKDRTPTHGYAETREAAMAAPTRRRLTRALDTTRVWYLGISNGPCL
jgi:hypothetical protein